MTAKKYLYEIRVPTRTNAGKPIRTAHHREWDKRVIRIAGGLSVLASDIIGKWISPENQLFTDRCIPVRIMCTKEEIEKIADLTAQHYQQKAILYFKVSDEVVIKHYG